MDELKSLHVYEDIIRLNDCPTVNDILRPFDEYKELIMDRIYHPLKTMDSVPRYKIPIMKILSTGFRIPNKAKMAEQAIQRSKYITADDAMEISYRINESTISMKIWTMLAEIDRKGRLIPVRKKCDIY